MLQTFFASAILIGSICAFPTFETEPLFIPFYGSAPNPGSLEVLPIPSQSNPSFSQFPQEPSSSFVMNYPSIAGPAISQPVIANYASANNLLPVFAKPAAASDFQPVIPNSAAASSSQFLNANTASANTNTASASTNTASASANTVSASTTVESFSNLLSQAALSIPALQNFLQIQIPSYEITYLFYAITHQILVAHENPDVDALSQVLSQAAGGNDVFTLPMYFQAIGNTLEKYLLSEGVLFPETLSSLAQSYASFIEDSLESSNVNSNETLFQAFVDGFVNFLQSLGFKFRDISTQVGYLLSSELEALQNG